MNLFSQNLVEMRKKRGLSQAELAQKVNLDVPQIEGIELGAKPSIEVMMSISSALGKSLKYMLTHEVVSAPQTVAESKPLIEQMEEIVKTSNYTLFAALQKQNLFDTPDSKGNTIYEYINQYRNFDFLILYQEAKKQTHSIADTTKSQNNTSQKANGEKSVYISKKLLISLLLLVITSFVLYFVPIFNFNIDFMEVSMDGNYSLLNLLLNSNTFYTILNATMLIILAYNFFNAIVMLSNSLSKNSGYASLSKYLVFGSNLILTIIFTIFIISGLPQTAFILLGIYLIMLILSIVQLFAKGQPNKTVVNYQYQKGFNLISLFFNLIYAGAILFLGFSGAQFTYANFLIGMLGALAVELILSVLVISIHKGRIIPITKIYKGLSIIAILICSTYICYTLVSNSINGYDIFGNGLKFYSYLFTIVFGLVSLAYIIVQITLIITQKKIRQQ